MKKVLLYSLFLVLPVVLLTGCWKKDAQPESQDTSTTQPQTTQPDATQPDTSKQSAPATDQPSALDDREAEEAEPTDITATEKVSIFTAAADQGDTKKCEELSGSNLIRECQNAVIMKKAVAEKNSSVCLEMTEEEDQLACQKKVEEAQKTN